MLPPYQVLVRISRGVALRVYRASAAVQRHIVVEALISDRRGGAEPVVDCRDELWAMHRSVHVDAGIARPDPDIGGAITVEILDFGDGRRSDVGTAIDVAGARRRERDPKGRRR